MRNNWLVILCLILTFSTMNAQAGENLGLDVVLTVTVQDDLQRVTLKKAVAEYELFGSPDWSIYAGFLNHRWSVGELSTLVLDTDYGYPGIGNRGELFGLKWDQFAAVLDLSSKRMLLGHRLEYATEKAVFGVSETSVLQEDFSLGMLIPLPIMSYQISQFLFDQWSQKINNFSNVFVLIPIGEATVYGEFMVDHLAAYPWDRVRLPQAYGYLLGFDWNPDTNWRVIGEYSKVNSYVGNHRETGHYLYRDDLLGYRQGPDSVLYQGAVEYDLNKDLAFMLGGVVHRKGEWDLGEPWDSSYNEKPVPTGVVQTTYGVIFGGTYNINDNLSLLGEISGGRVTNQGHQEGQAGWFGSLKAAVQFSLF